MITQEDIDAFADKRGRIVGLTGLAGSGKTTVSNALLDHGWKTVKMAGALKSMARALFVECGLDPDMCLEGSMKEARLDQINGVSPRHIMQTLGTEWGRMCVSQSFWVDIAQRKCERLLAKGIDVVVDDVRFQNEADMIRDLGGCVVGIVGRGGIAGSHSSEGGVEPDFSIHNDRDIHYLQNMVVRLLHCVDIE